MSIIQTQEKSVLKGNCGTQSYLPPEAFETYEWDLFKGDIYALGIILFSLNYNYTPFDSSKITSSFYKMIRGLQYERFFKLWEKTLKLKMDQDFKDLFVCMV